MGIQPGAARPPERFATTLRRILREARGRLVSKATVLEASGSPESIHRTRKTIAAAFLRGAGVEIGALHQPLQVPSSARVTHVDRMSAADLRLQYPELAVTPLVEADIIDNGEELTTIGDNSQDFVVANHFLEHCQNPIRTLQNLSRVLKSSGVVYLAVPDKRFTFDVDRPSTTVDHVIRDFSEGPAWSKRQHFEEWTRLVNKRRDNTEVEEEVRHLIEIDYSIHFHVWTAVDLLDFIRAVQPLVLLELELFARNGPETVLILRKASATIKAPTACY